MLAGCVNAGRSKPAPAGAHSAGAPLPSIAEMADWTAALLDAVRRDAQNDDSNHDLGGDVIPAIVAAGDAGPGTFVSVTASANTAFFVGGPGYQGGTLFLALTVHP